MSRLCPACYRNIQPTRSGAVAAHTDKAGRACEGSGLPLDAAMRNLARKYTRKKPAPPPSPKFLKCAAAQNQRRAAEGSRRRITQAHQAIRILETHKPGTSTRFHNGSIRALMARIRYPDATLGQIAAELGVTKDAYASSLRRALEYAQRVETNTQRQVSP